MASRGGLSWVHAVLCLMLVSVPLVSAWLSSASVSSFQVGLPNLVRVRGEASDISRATRTHRPWTCTARDEPELSRRGFLQALLGGVGAAAVMPLGSVEAAENPQSFTVAFNASKGSLGIGLQELRYPRKKAPWDKQLEVVTVSSVDPYGQGVKQDKRIRPGLIITHVQGRGVEGLPAKEVIKQLEDEMLARSAGEARVAEEEGLPELVEISFSAKCISTPEEPDYCYNSVQPLDSVVGMAPP